MSDKPKVPPGEVEKQGNDNTVEQQIEAVEQAQAPDRDEKQQAAATRPDAAAGDTQTPVQTKPLTIVGIGASAGGLEAFTQLLNQLPADTGLALVFVQHLASHHESALPHLLGGATRMPVLQAEEGMKLEANRVYVIPPGVHLEIDGDRFHLTPRPQHDGLFMPVDYFFHSLASIAQEQVVGHAHRGHERQFLVDRCNARC